MDLFLELNRLVTLVPVTPVPIFLLYLQDVRRHEIFHYLHVALFLLRDVVLVEETLVLDMKLYLVVVNTVVLNATNLVSVL